MQAEELNDQIAINLVVKIAKFYEVEYSVTTSEVNKMIQTYLAKINNVLKVKARVKRSNSFAESVYLKSVKGVPLKSQNIYSI